MIDIAYFHGIAMTIISSLALILNGILLYLIVFHSDFKVKAYKKILLMTCIADSVFALICFVVRPALLSGRGYMICLSNGIFANYSRMFDLFGLTIYCAALHCSMVCIAAQFVYRYRFTCYAEDPKNPSFVWQTALFTVTYCITQATDAAWMFALDIGDDHRQEGLEIMTENYGWKYDNGSLPYPIMSHSAELKAFVHNAFYMLSSAGGYTMAITPLILLMGPEFFYISSIMLETQSPLSAMLTLSTTSIAVVNPLTTMYFVKSYRRIIQRFLSNCFLGIGNRVAGEQVSVSTSSVGGSSTNFSKAPIANADSQFGDPALHTASHSGMSPKLSRKLPPLPISAAKAVETSKHE
uniref:G protein-coupled receptor n=1 Tax=Ditylenchus dipsaci TaxID=166011 RepID=A0A915EFT4_9BILA